MDNTQDIQNVIGVTDESIDGYFRKPFPKLIPLLYKFVVNNCKGVAAFKVYCWCIKKGCMLLYSIPFLLTLGNHFQN